MGHGVKEFRRGLELPLMIHTALGLASHRTIIHQLLQIQADSKPFKFKLHNMVK